MTEPELPVTFGKYYLTEKLATGGMAEIYLAKLIGPDGFEKQLVIKQIHPKLSGQRQFVDLFVAEAKTLVTLAHGNIVPVYELGVVDDTYFIAMEYIDGPTLYRLTESMARQGAVMEPAVAAWIAARIVDGLDYAHRKGEGVIHRDLSPRNVMLSRDGEVKLVDFGIAVTLGEPGERSSSNSAAGPTGSFPYMSPEQVRREPLSGKSDLFSAGVLLWEMLVGHRLFARAEAEATLAAVLHEDIARPSSERTDVPAKLDDVVMRALERDQAARWDNAGDMLAALNRFLYALDEPPSARDVTALVARYCPPSTRRLPTHLEGVVHDTPTRDRGGADSGPIAAGDGGPRTAVIPRGGVAHGRGQRHKTFATHVDIQGMLRTPPHGLPAIKSGDATTAAGDAERSQSPNGGALGGRGRNLIALAGVGSIALAGVTLYIVLRDRAALLAAGDAGIAPSRDANPHADDARRDAALALDRDAMESTVDAELVTPHDAGRRDVHDALVPIASRDSDPGRDASARIDAPAAVTGTATLAIGAAPWGEIYVDGKKLREQAPATITVPAGHHTIEVAFPPDGPAARKSFEIDVGAGETKSVQADFTR